MKPLAITGLGVVSPFGVGVEALRDGLAGAQHAPFGDTDASTPVDLAPYSAAQVAAVRGFDPTAWLGPTGLRNNDRLTKLQLVAARMALAHAGIKSKGLWQRLAPDDVGVVGATAYGSLEAIHELNVVARTEDPRYLNPARFPNTVINSSVGYVSIWDELRALNATVVNGPPGALDAVATAAMYLAARRAKVLLGGGGEALSELLLLGLQRSGAFASGALRVGEGAAFVALEAPAEARAAGIPELARVIGYGTAFEPGEPDERGCAPSARALERASIAALRDACVAPAEVDVVVTGLGGLPSCDMAERRALRSVFGPSQCMAAPKRLYGETFGASGALALASALTWLANSPVSAVVQGVAPSRVCTCVVTALGYHGNASALVLRGPREEP